MLSYQHNNDFKQNSAKKQTSFIVCTIDLSPIGVSGCNQAPSLIDTLDVACLDLALCKPPKPYRNILFLESGQNRQRAACSSRRD
jgi:hypothetical protein